MRAISGRVLLLATLLAIGSGCGSPPAPPAPGEARGMVPDLRGYSVMVLPIQLKAGVPQGLSPDLEIAYALRTRGEGVTWTFPPELEDVLQRSPSVRAQTRGLPVQTFLQAEVNRVGDPLFGNLVRLSGLTGADVAILPVELKWGESGSYQLSAALIGIRTGRVSWYGVLEGSQGEAEDPATLASVTELLARALLPFE